MVELEDDAEAKGISDDIFDVGSDDECAYGAGNDDQSTYGGGMASFRVIICVVAVFIGCRDLGADRKILKRVQLGMRVFAHQQVLI